MARSRLSNVCCGSVSTVYSFLFSHILQTQLPTYFLKLEFQTLFKLEFQIRIHLRRYLFFAKIDIRKSAEPATNVAKLDAIVVNDKTSEEAK